MGRKKSVVRIPSSALVKCPGCGKRTKVSLSLDNSLYRLECPKCKQTIATPPACCCLVCAFSNKQCPQSLMMEAKMRGYDIRYDKLSI